jgi:hypothetical protein
MGRRVAPIDDGESRELGITVEDIETALTPGG